MGYGLMVHPLLFQPQQERDHETLTLTSGSTIREKWDV